MTYENLGNLYYLDQEIKMDERRILELRTQEEGAPAYMREGLSEIRQIIEDKRRRCIAERDALRAYIAAIPDDFTRQVFRYRFEEALTWAQIAHRLGGSNSSDAVRQIVRRYVEAHP